jgi:hypothetical protein
MNGLRSANDEGVLNLSHFRNYVKYMRARGLEVCAWTVNDEREMVREGRRMRRGRDMFNCGTFSVVFSGLDVPKVGDSLPHGRSPHCSTHCHSAERRRRRREKR